MILYLPVLLFFFILFFFNCIGRIFLGFDQEPIGMRHLDYNRAMHRL